MDPRRDVPNTRGQLERHFVQDTTRIAAFGSTTHQAAKEHNLIIDVPVPSPKFASMAQALEAYVDEVNKGK